MLFGKRLMSEMPLVSVIIPAFERPVLLARAIESVQKQTYSNIELLVIDDCSCSDFSTHRTLLKQTDGTLHRLPRRSGVAAARNFGLENAQGAYIAFLDSDDEWLPEKLATQVAYHLQQSHCLISQTDEIWIRNGRRVNKAAKHAQARGEAFNDCLQRCCISPSSVLLHHSVFSEVGVFDEALPSCEDYDLWLRVAQQFQIGYISEPLVVKYGGASDQLSKHFEAMDRFRIYSLLRLLDTVALSDAQRDAVLQELRQKVAVFLQGAVNRSSNWTPLANSIMNSINENTLTEIPKLTAALKDSWLEEAQQYYR